MPILKVAQFNVENLFIFADRPVQEDDIARGETEWQKLSSALMPNKSLKKLHQIVEVIDDMDPDILLLNEVGGIESIKNFSKAFLKGRYEPYLQHGNSDRGIDNGFLIKRSLRETLGLSQVLLLSHRDRKLRLPANRGNPYEQTLYFSRDVSELRLFRTGNTSPFLIILGVHLKSKMDREGCDTHCHYRREAEILTLIDIYTNIRNETSDQTPALIAGDFNGNFYQDGEFLHLQSDVRFKDILEIAQIAPEQRYTQVQVPPQGKPFHVQLDYILVPEQFASRVQREGTNVYRFKDESGSDYPAPTSLMAKHSLPSDHYPVICLFQLDV